MNFSDAKALAQSYVRESERVSGVPLKLIEEDTMEWNLGWVFFYDVDEAKSRELIAGNGPLLVDKQTGMIHACRPGYPIEAYIQAYERTGSVDIVNS